MASGARAPPRQLAVSSRDTTARIARRAKWSMKSIFSFGEVLQPVRAGVDVGHLAHRADMDHLLHGVGHRLLAELVVFGGADAGRLPARRRVPLLGLNSSGGSAPFWPFDEPPLPPRQAAADRVGVETVGRAEPDRPCIHVLLGDDVGEPDRRLDRRRPPAPAEVLAGRRVELRVDADRAPVLGDSSESARRADGVREDDLQRLAVRPQAHAVGTLLQPNLVEDRAGLAGS